MRKVFVVRLPQEEREQLVALVKAGKAPALKLTRARILLKADQQERGPAWTDTEIAEALDVSLKTIFNVRRRWVEHGLEGPWNAGHQTARLSRASWMGRSRPSWWQRAAARRHEDARNGPCGSWRPSWWNWRPWRQSAPRRCGKR